MSKWKYVETEKQDLVDQKSMKVTKLKHDTGYEQDGDDDFLNECYTGVDDKAAAFTSLRVERAKRQGLITLCKSYLETQFKRKYKPVNEPTEASMWKMFKDKWAPNRRSPESPGTATDMSLKFPNAIMKWYADKKKGIDDPEPGIYPENMEFGKDEGNDIDNRARKLDFTLLNQHIQIAASLADQTESDGEIFEGWSGWTSVTDQPNPENSAGIAMFALVTSKMAMTEDPKRFVNDLGAFSEWPMQPQAREREDEGDTTT